MNYHAISEFLLWIMACGVFGLLGWNIYKELKECPKDLVKRKYIEYGTMLAGGIVLFILLKTVWRDQMAAAYNYFFHLEHPGLPNVPVAPPTDWPLR